MITVFVVTLNSGEIILYREHDMAIAAIMEAHLNAHAHANGYTVMRVEVDQE